MIVRSAARACAAQSGRGAQSDTPRVPCPGSAGARGEPLDLPSAPLTRSFDLQHLFARLVDDVQRPMTGKHRHEPQEARAEIYLKQLHITAVPRGLSDSVTRNMGPKARSERSRCNIPQDLLTSRNKQQQKHSCCRFTGAQPCRARRHAQLALRDDLPKWHLLSLMPIHRLSQGCADL